MRKIEEERIGFKIELFDIESIFSFYLAEVSLESARSKLICLLLNELERKRLILCSFLPRFEEVNFLLVAMVKWDRIEFLFLNKEYLCFWGVRI